MPGGRLTQQERQQIALGVADGLAYAEIARRLDRPTSTITREVMRNGGPTGYRADLAHRATERRAHRRRQAPPLRAGAPSQAHGRDADAVREYEETFATVFMQQGLPKMTSRVLASSTPPTRAASPRPNSSSASRSAQRPSPKRSHCSTARASSAGNATNAAASATWSTTTSGTRG